MTHGYTIVVTIVTTRRKLFFFIFLQHTLHYVFHGTLVLHVFGATYCCGCIIDMLSLDPEYKTTAFFTCISKKKTFVLYSNKVGVNMLYYYQCFMIT